MRIASTPQEAKRLLEALRVLGEREFMALELLNRLQPLVQSICEDGSFEEDKYLEVAGQIIDHLAQDAWNPEVARAILGLARLHAGVREPIERHNLFSPLADVAVEAPDDCTDFNDALMADLVFHHYFWHAHGRRQQEGLAGLIRYLNEQPYLWTDRGRFHLRSIVHDVVNTAIPRDDTDALRRLLAELKPDPGVTRMIEKRMAPRQG